VTALAQFAASDASAEVTDVRVAQQYGFSYLQLMIIERERLLEKHPNAAGLSEVKVTWSNLQAECHE